MIIEDGAGSGNKAKVNKNNQLQVVTASAIHQASLRGDAYAWNAVSANIDTTDCMICIANYSDSRLLVISHAWMRGDIAGQLDIKLSDVTGLTLAGTAITAVNLNRSSPNKPDALAYSDETQSAATTLIMTMYQHLAVNAQTTTGPMMHVDFKDAIILGKNDAFGIDTILEPAAGFEATVFGYYIDA
jgi:hypothetical protein